jgi:hypothetical protein
MIVVVELGDLGSGDEDMAVENVYDVSTSARTSFARTNGETGVKNGGSDWIGSDEVKYLVDMMLPRWQCLPTQLCLDGDERTVGVYGWMNGRGRRHAGHTRGEKGE